MRRSVVVRWLLTALVATSCSTQAKQALPAPTTPSTLPPTTTTTTTLPPRFPLTGVLVTDAAKAARPVVSVKIDNSGAARPQAGIDRADLVYEEFTEGITRLVVVFHSGEAEAVGPVRSVRPADPVIINPLGGVLGFSGGSPAAEEVARASPLTLVTEADLEVMQRRSGRFAPHNLYTSTAGLLSRAPPEAKAPPKFADFLRAGQGFTAAGATPASHLSLVPAPYVTADYGWDPESHTWKRSTDGVPHVVEGDVQLAPTNVIVQFTPYVVFAGDSTVLYPEVVGSGEAWIFAAGTLVKGTWSKASPEAVTTFADPEGRPIVFPPGQTWVHLVEPGSAVTPA